LYFANLHVNRGPAGEKNRFHMDDDGDLREQVLHIEAHIEELDDVIESCRKFILVSKAGIAAGGALILAISIGAVGFDPTVMIGALAAVIGGTVVRSKVLTISAELSCYARFGP
jgi:hypothetical protein